MFKYIQQNIKFTDQEKQSLKDGAVDLATTGSILHDFKVMLDYIIANQPSITKSHQLRLQVLNELNEQMKRPLQHDLKRAIQKSFPNLSGLYLILRASGLTFVIINGKTAKLVVDETALSAWYELNPTEQYFTLFESWLLRGTSEILGDSRGGRMPLNNCLDLFAQFSWKSSTLSSNGDSYFMKYSPEWHNLALLEMFGMVTVKVGDVVAGKGWQPEEVSPTLFGRAMFGLLAGEVSRDMDLLYGFNDVSTIPRGKLQPLFQPYFPAWQHNLEQKETPAFRDGLYIFKASLSGRVWRRIAVPAEYSLEGLGGVILRAFEFDNDHLHRFVYRNQLGAKTAVNHDYMDDGPFTSDVQVGDVPLRVGASMLFNFDFGDNWHFDVVLERIDSDTDIDGASILESHGDAPPQYHYYDEDDEL